MLLNWAMNRMNGPRFLPSGKRFGPYFSSRLEPSPASRPFSVSVVRRLTTWSTAMVCQVIPSAVGLAFGFIVDRLGTSFHQSSLAAVLIRLNGHQCAEYASKQTRRRDLRRLPQPRQ